jgi:gluconokinase
LAVQWVREKFYPDLSSEAGYRQLFADAAAISPGAEGVMVLPFFAGERSPYWNASARATITGLGLDHDRRHVARAVLEGVAFRLGDIWDALGAPAIDEPARLTGGITHSTLWSQIVADVLGIPLISLEAADASAIGAALLGFQALGVSVTLEEQISSDREDNLLIPDGDRHAKYSNLRRLFQTLYWKVTSPEVV